jgi:hypothetical protein
MNRIIASLGFLTMSVAASNAFGAAEAPPKAAGHWEGKIQLSAKELRISVDLASTAQGIWAGSMSVLGSTALDVPLQGIAVDDASVRFSALLPEHASFEGHLSAEGVLAGMASNAEGDAPFQLTRTGEPNVRVPAPSSALTKDFAGAWEGAIQTGGATRRVGLKLAPAADGSAMATLIAGDKNTEIPVTTVTITGSQLQLEARAVSGTFRGALGSEGDISGEWQQGPNRISLTFRRVPQAAAKNP